MFNQFFHNRFGRGWGLSQGAEVGTGCSRGRQGLGGAGYGNKPGSLSKLAEPPVVIAIADKVHD
jgi:hypothetical protein